MPHLPQELIDQIIDDPSNTLETLCACSRTSSSWLPRSRLNLHNSLRIGLPPTSSNFPRQIGFFLDNPEATTYVKELSIEMETDELGRWPLTFPNTESLKLSHIIWSRTPPTAQAFLTTQLHSVSSVWLLDVEFDTFKNFTAFLHGFPNLKNLKLTRIRFKQFLIPPHKYGQVELKLDNLQLDSGDIPHYGFMGWLKQQSTAPLVKNLYLKGGRGESSSSGGMRYLREWCSVTGNSVRDLRFEVGSVQTNVVFNEQVASLVHCTELRCLEIKAIIINSSSLRWLPILLSYISSNHIRRITLHLHFDTLANLNEEGLARIDDVLFGIPNDTNPEKRDQGKSLHSLELVLWYNYIAYPDFSYPIRWIEDKMPKAAKCGALNCYRAVEYEATFKNEAWFD